jgi:spore coat protein JB
MDKDNILRELTALDFMLVDLQLFLDTHPEDHEALNRYNEILAKANVLRGQYESMCGPLYSFRSFNPCHWDWYNDPWPWQYSFNFDLPGEECK